MRRNSSRMIVSVSFPALRSAGSPVARNDTFPSASALRSNAPLLTFDVMALKHLPHGISAGLIVGTVQQLGNDSGPTADKLNGFRGHDLAIGPIVTYDTKLNGKTPLSLSARWVPTVTSQNRLSSTRTFMVNAAIAF